jgi:preprotein translocase subunit SecD
LESLDCAAPDRLRGHVDPHLPLITCDSDSQTKYVLNPSFLTGTEVADATAHPNNVGAGWVVTLSFTSNGTKAWADFTSANVGKQVALVLDGSVLSAPVINEPIFAGETEISGRFTQEQARQLADRLASR